MHKPASLPGRSGGRVQAAGRGVGLVSDAAARVSCRGRSGCWKPRQHTPPTARLGRRSFPSSLPKTSDGKIVRQLLTSIKKKKKKCSSIHFQFSHTPLGQMAQPMPRTSRDGAASADFKKERLLRSALRHRRSLQLPEDPKATTRARGGGGGGGEQVLWLTFPSFLSLAIPSQFQASCLVSESDWAVPF